MAGLDLPGDLGGDERALVRSAIGWAGAAGRLLVEHLARHGSTEGTLAYKGRRELVTAADTASEKLIVEAIRATYPDHAVLAEEGIVSPRGKADKEAELCWVIDPLDGTTNFVHRHPSFSVSLGLLRRGEPWLGIVHAPLFGNGGETYYAAIGRGAWRDGQRLRVSPTPVLREAIVATGFPYNRNEPGANTNLESFGRVLMEVRDVRRCGSAALDLAHVAAGVYDAYWELNLEPYDVAAGIVLVRAAGGEVRDLGSGRGPLIGGEIVATNGRLTGEILPLLSGRTTGFGTLTP